MDEYFTELRLNARMSLEDIARLFSVHISTVYRWQIKGAPLAETMVLQYRAGMAPGWEGFRFTEKHVELLNDGECYKPCFIASFRYHLQQHRMFGYNAGKEYAERRTALELDRNKPPPNVMIFPKKLG